MPEQGGRDMTGQVQLKATFADLKGWASLKGPKR